MKFNASPMLERYQSSHKEPNYLADNPSSLRPRMPSHPFSPWEKGTSSLMHFKHNSTDSDEAVSWDGNGSRLKKLHQFLHKKLDHSAANGHFQIDTTFHTDEIVRWPDKKAGVRWQEGGSLPALQLRQTGIFLSSVFVSFLGDDKCEAFMSSVKNRIESRIKRTSPPGSRAIQLRCKNAAQRPWSEILLENYNIKCLSTKLTSTNYLLNGYK